MCQSGAVEKRLIIVLATLVLLVGVLALWASGEHIPGAVIVAAGIAAAFAPTALEKYEARRRAVALAPRDDPAPNLSSAQLLSPHSSPITFRGRARELTQLTDWCGSADVRGLRLVTGPGGVGKTRLSLRLAEVMERKGWTVVRLRLDDVASGISRHRAASHQDTVFVLDYAETATQLDQLLGEYFAVAHHPRCRVLLLARTAGDWWDNLRSSRTATEHDELSDAQTQIEIRPDIGLTDPIDQLVLDMARDFAARIRHDFPAVSATVPTSVRVTSGSADPRMLDLAAAALIAVLEGNGSSPTSVNLDQVLDKTLEHEARYWSRRAHSANLDTGHAVFTPKLQAEVVAAVSLLGGSTDAHLTDAINRAAPGMPHAGILGWLKQLYPPSATSDAPYALTPDRLAEHLIVRSLDRNPALAERMLSSLTSGQLIRVLVVLGRAYRDRLSVAMHLEVALRQVSEEVDALPDDRELLEALAFAIPYPSVALAELRARVIQRIHPILPREDDPGRALWLTSLGVALSELGKPDQALPVTEEAVTLYRDLATRYPDRYTPDLARSLTNLGIRFSELGKPDQALPVTEEAVTLRRDLATRYPDRYTPDLARAEHLLAWIREQLAGD
mgnify:CR=1 FL=1